MYTAYFGLREAPFNVTPDPRFLYTNPVYQEAYASLQYGICARKGFLVLTGEVGTGKTTLLRRLMGSLEQNVHCVFFYNTSLSFDELLSFTCTDLGLSVPEEATRLKKIQALNDFLLAQLAVGGTGALLIDEAQNLEEEVLENLRLLSNLETSTEKLVQIVLVGQPELEQKLAQPQLRQLKQRVVIRCRLDRLQKREVGPFIAHRLRVAGYARGELFTARAVARIAGYSGGTPRLINVICDNALLIAYGTHQRTVTGAIIDEVAQALQLSLPSEEVEKGPRQEDSEAARTTAPVTTRAPENKQEEIVSASADWPPLAAREPGQKPEEVPWPVADWSPQSKPRFLLRMRFGVFLILLLLGVAGATIYSQSPIALLPKLLVQVEVFLGAAETRFAVLRHNLSAWFTLLSAETTEQSKDDASAQIQPSLTAGLQSQEQGESLWPGQPLTSAEQAESGEKISLAEGVQEEAITVSPPQEPEPERQAKIERLHQEEEARQKAEAAKIAALRQKEEARRKAEEERGKSENVHVQLQAMGLSLSETSLLESAETGDTRGATLLLTAGISPNIQDAKGWTPLMYAAWNGHDATVQVLLDKSANANAQNETGKTAVILAAMHGHVTILYTLLSKGAHVNAADTKGWTPLMYAAWNGYTAVIQALLSRGADVNAKDKEGWNPLMYAAWNGHTATARALLDRNAEINARNNEGETALTAAVRQGDSAIVQLLKQAGASE